MRAVMDSQDRATTEAAESLHSQGKLTTPSRKNRKILHEIEMLKANEYASYVQELQFFRFVPKSICANLVRLSF
jgi:hypothetical protein